MASWGLFVLLWAMLQSVTGGVTVAEAAKRPAGVPEAGAVQAIRTTTRTGRRGAVYVPRSYADGSLPLLVLLHGTGGKGSLMILRATELAERERFIALAPDSMSVAGVWTVGRSPDEVTPDARHVMDAVREILALPGVRIDHARVLIAGYSVGGAAAPALASHETLFTAFAVLHGHVSLASLGPRRVRGWLSTGERDRIRTVAYTKEIAGQLARAGFAEITVRAVPGDHTFQDGELAALIAWWLRSERDVGVPRGQPRGGSVP